MDFEQFLLMNDFPAGSLSQFRDVLLKDNGRAEALFRFGNEEDVSFFNASVIALFEKKLGLVFENSSRNNVCLANHEEVRPEFRTSFTSRELLEYIFAVLSDSDFENRGANEKLILPFPAEPDIFWERVEQGKIKKRQFK